MKYAPYLFYFFILAMLGAVVPYFSECEKVVFIELLVCEEDVPREYPRRMSEIRSYHMGLYEDAPGEPARGTVSYDEWFKSQEGYDSNDPYLRVMKFGWILREETDTEYIFEQVVQ